MQRNNPSKTAVRLDLLLLLLLLQVTLREYFSMNERACKVGSFWILDFPFAIHSQWSG